MKNTLSALLFLVTISCSLVLIGCSQPEEPVEEIAEPVSVEPAKPEVGDMVLIPAGEFSVGTDDRDSARAPLEVPEHTSEVDAYQIDAYEVTNGQWIKFLTEGDYSPEGNWRPLYSIGKEDNPVTNVTLDDATAYCEWAGGRLPTEEEWEKAARGPEGFKYPWGDVFASPNCNCAEMGTRNIIEVGSVAADKSPYGVYDMMGNATEWTSDKLTPYAGSPDPRNEAFTKGMMVVRGGSYAMKGSTMSLVTRSGYYAKSQYGIGFRCVKDAAEGGGQ